MVLGCASYTRQDVSPSAKQYISHSLWFTYSNIIHDNLPVEQDSILCSSGVPSHNQSLCNKYKCQSRQNIVDLFHCTQIYFLPFPILWTLALCAVIRFQRRTVLSADTDRAILPEGCIEMEFMRPLHHQTRWEYIQKTEGIGTLNLLVAFHGLQQLPVFWSPYADSSVITGRKHVLSVKFYSVDIALLLPSQCAEFFAFLQIIQSVFRISQMSKEYDNVG